MADRDVEVVIAATQQEWAGRLVGWIRDHGGPVRVRRHYCANRREALEGSFDVLVAEAGSSVLDASLVHQLHQTRRSVVGVADPSQPATRSQLAELAVDRTVDANAAAAEMLAVIDEVAATRSRFDEVVEDLDDLDDAVGAAVPRPPGGEPASILTAVTGALEGTGATEVAVETAAQLRRRDESVTLVDCDVVAPRLACRLQTPLSPNLNAAVGAVQHGLGSLDEALLPVRRGGFDLVAGLEHPKRWGDLDPEAVAEVLDALATHRHHVVVNVASPLEDTSRHAVTRAVIARADQIVCTCEQSPAGLVQLCRWLDAAEELTEATRVRVVANRAGPRELQSQFERELLRTAAVADITHLPPDRRVAKATRAGELVCGGRWVRAMRRFARTLPRPAPGTAATPTREEPLR